MKNSKLLHRALAAGVLVAAITAPSIAKADFVCSTFYLPGASILGDEGYVSATYYSSPGCAGSYLYSKQYCSAGANTAACASSPSYRYDRASLVGLVEALRAAAEAGQRVYAYTTGCFFGGTGCGSVVSFNAS
jgi:hypothetical protein